MAVHICVRDEFIEELHKDTIKILEELHKDTIKILEELADVWDPKTGRETSVLNATCEKAANLLERYKIIEVRKEG